MCVFPSCEICHRSDHFDSEPQELLPSDPLYHSFMHRVCIQHGYICGIVSPVKEPRYTKASAHNILHSSNRIEIYRWLEITWIGIIINALDATTSVLIASFSIYYLLRERTGFKRSETIVNRLIIYAINTGLVTSICSILTLIFVCFITFVLRKLEWLKEIIDCCTSFEDDIHLLLQPIRQTWVLQFFWWWIDTDSRISLLQLAPRNVRYSQLSESWHSLTLLFILSRLNSRNKIRQAAGSSLDASDRRVSFTNILDRRAQAESNSVSHTLLHNTITKSQSSPLSLTFEILESNSDNNSNWGTHR